MSRYLSVILTGLIFWSFNSVANDQRDFVYAGQPEESLNLQTYVSETRYRERQVEETCYRDEPYEQRICRTETYYRRVCRTEPGRRVCRTQPGRRVCRVRNGRRVCRTEPGRRVCSRTPDRRVCSNVPDTRRVCRTETRYRRVPYTCYRTIREPYEVQVDHYANVRVIFEGNSPENHNFLVTLDNNLNVQIEQTNNTHVRAELMDTSRNVRRGDRSSTVDVVFTMRFVRRRD